MNRIQMTLALFFGGLVPLAMIPQQAHAQMSKVKTVWVILMENHNWTGDNSGAAFGDPDLKGSPNAPYVNNVLVNTAAYSNQYFNPPNNHPSLPNYLWLEAGANFHIKNDILPKSRRLQSQNHLVEELNDAGIAWRAYAEPDFGNPDFTDCPLDYSEIDVNHLAFDYFADDTNHFKSSSPDCEAHVKPYDQLQTDLANNTAAQYNFITPNLCHDGHEGTAPCDPSESSDNTRRGDAWLQSNVPLITGSTQYKEGGALFIIWDEAEDGGAFSDGPIGMFLLSPFAKGAGAAAYSNSIRYDHSSTLKTLQEIFGVTPLLGAASNPATTDLGDLFAP